LEKAKKANVTLEKRLNSLGDFADTSEQAEDFIKEMSKMVNDNNFQDSEEAIKYLADAKNCLAPFNQDRRDQLFDAAKNEIKEAKDKVKELQDLGAPLADFNSELNNTRAYKALEKYSDDLIAAADKISKLRLELEKLIEELKKPIQAVTVVQPGVGISKEDFVAKIANIRKAVHSDDSSSDGEEYEEEYSDNEW
jgi:hypothetical protein